MLVTISVEFLLLRHEHNLYASCRGINETQYLGVLLELQKEIM